MIPILTISLDLYSRFPFLPFRSFSNTLKIFVRSIFCFLYISTSLSSSLILLAFLKNIYFILFASYHRPTITSTGLLSSHAHIWNGLRKNFFFSHRSTNSKNCFFVICVLKYPFMYRSNSRNRLLSVLTFLKSILFTG